MRNHWVITSKLQPPAAPADLMERAAWPGELAPVTVLQAGPGYGKTLAMAALSRSADEPARVWYTLDPYDADVATFFHYLVAGMDAVIPQFGAELEALLMAGQSEPQLLFQAFFKAVEAYGLPALHLVLDDFHHLQAAQPELVKALVYFFDKLPAGVHLLIATRKRLSAPLGRLVTQGRVTVIEASQLAFSAEEVERYLRERASGTAVPAAWLKQAAALEGWPLGLELLTRVTDPAALRWAPERDVAAALSEFVAGELFLAQTPVVRELLLKVSLLHAITPEACRWVFQMVDAAPQLAALEQDHLVQALADGSYRMPGYLQEYLRLEVARTVSALTRAEWHRRAAAYYQDLLADELAIPHLIALRDWTAAAVCCHEAFPAMGLSGRRATIERWLDAFPPEVTASEPYVLLWRGHGLVRRGQVQEALASYARARQLLQAREDRAGEFGVRVREATLAAFRGDMKALGPLLFAAQALVAEGRPADVADFHITRALAAEHRGDLALMRECNEAVLTIPVDGRLEVASCHGTALMNLYTSALHEGRLAAARQHLTQALALAEAWGLHSYRVFANFLLAHLHLTVGEVEEAHGLLRRLPAFWEASLDFHERAIAHTVLGQYHGAREEWKEAEAALQRSSAIFEEAGHADGSKVPLEQRLWLALRRKDAARVKALMAEAGELDVNSVHDLALRIPHARALHLGGEPEAALSELQAAIPELAGMGARLHVARARLFEAATLVKLGRKEQAEQALEAAMALIEAEGYTFLRGHDRTLWDELMPLLTPSTPVVSAEAVVPAAEGRLSLRCFGGFEVRQGGVLIEAGLRRKAKLILATLALARRGLMLVDVAERLGVTAFTPGNMRTFQADISEIRRALEPAIAKGKDSRYLKFADERYALVPEAIESVDLWAFDQAVAEGDRLRDSAPASAAAHYEAAMALMRGNVLDEGSFLKYFEGEREAYRQQGVGVLRWLARFHQERGDFTGAEAALRRAVDLSPVDEDLYLALMRHHHARKDPERMRQAYWDGRKAFKAALGATPSPDYEAEYRQLLSLQA